MLKRLMRYYWLDILLAVVFMTIAIKFAIDEEALISAIARKTALASAGLVYYYITRVLKIGYVYWSDPYDKVYAVALLFYVGLVFAFG